MKPSATYPPAPLRISHFFDWHCVSDPLLDTLFGEFADSGGEALTTATVWSNRILGDPAFAATLRQKLAAHRLAMKDAHAPWSLPWDLDIEDAGSRHDSRLECVKGQSRCRSCQPERH